MAADVALTIRVSGAAEAAKGIQQITDRVRSVGVGGEKAVAGLAPLQTSVRGLSQSMSVLGSAVGGMSTLLGEAAGAGTVTGQALQSVGTAASTAGVAVGVLRAALVGLKAVAPELLLIGAAILATIGGLEYLRRRQIADLEAEAKSAQERLQLFQDVVARRKLELDIATRNKELGQATTADVDKARRLYIDSVKWLKSITFEKNKQLELDLQIALAIPAQVTRGKTIAQILSETVRRTELLAKINQTSNADLIDQLEQVYLRFARIPGAAQKIGIELLALRAQIVDLRRAAGEMLDPLEDFLRYQGGVIASLKDQGRAWEGVASEAERAAGWMGRATELSTQAVATVQAQVLEESLAATRRRLIAETQAYKDALDEATRAQEDWNRQNEFDARQQAVVEAGLQRRLALLQRSLELMDEGTEKRRSEIASFREIERAIKDEIVALESEVAAKIAAGLATDALVESQKRLKDILEEIQHRAALAGKALTEELLRPWTEMVQGIQGAFQTFFTDILSGTQSLGEALVNLWNNIANEIIRIFARIAAEYMVLQLLTGLGGLFGVDLTKFIPKRQRGGELIVTRPTLMTVGEAGAERVTVQPISGPMQRRAPAQEQGQGPTILMPITINAVDAQSFLSMAQRSGRGLAEIMLGEMRKNSTLGKLLGGASVP